MGPITAARHLILPDYQTKPAEIISPPSFLIDRFVPDCEIIALPQKRVAGGTLALSLAQIIQEPKPVTGLKQRLRRVSPKSRQMPGLFCDLRHHTPQNWAHFLNNHLPYIFTACAEMDLAWSDVTLVLPEACPGYIRAAAAIFGFELVATDDLLQGQALLIEADPWTGCRSVRDAWVDIPQVVASLDLLPKKRALPEKVFLTRRTTRQLLNAAEIEAWLSARGFVTLVPEELSAADQMRLFREAREIVAIHGAALAPLLYCPAAGKLERLIELMPCGHMTDVYRVIADKVGVQWTAVRGRMKPEYIAPAYDFDKPFAQFSQDPFAVDLTALELAFLRSA